MAAPVKEYLQVRNRRGGEARIVPDRGGEIY